MLAVIVLVVLCAATTTGFSQCAGFGQSCRVGGYYPGGGYPGGGYPGSGYPGSGYPGGGYPGGSYPGSGYPGNGYPGGGMNNRQCCRGQGLICRSTGMGGTRGTCMRVYV